MSKRLEEELEEILRQAEDLRERRRAPRTRGRAGQRSGLRLTAIAGSVSPGKLFMVSVALLLSALLVRGYAPGVVGYLFWAGLVLFIAAYGLFFVRAESASSRPRWRGRPVDYGRRPPTPWDRLRGWLGR